MMRTLAHVGLHAMPLMIPGWWRSCHCAGTVTDPGPDSDSEPESESENKVKER